MMNFKKICVLTMAVLSLSACDQQKSYSYLVRHPNVLKSEITTCQNATSSTPAQTKYCETVMQAARDFMTMLDEWQSDQEAFGQKVLLAQLDCTKAKEGVQTASVELKELEKQKADDESIQLAKEKLALAQKDSEEKRHLLQTMYGVLSLSTPD